MDGGFRGGGSRALLSAFDKAGGHLYADVLRFYGVDLADLFSEVDPLPPKRAMALIEGLPADSQSACLLRGEPESAGWANNTYLLLSLLNAVHQNTWLLQAVNSRKRIPPFKPIAGPGAERRKKASGNSFMRMAKRAWEMQERNK